MVFGRSRHGRYGGPRERSPGLIALFGLMMFFLLAGGIIAYYFIPNPDLLFARRNGQPISTEPVRIAFNEGELLVPRNLIARTKRRTPLGGVRQVDLQLPWPYVPRMPTKRPEEATSLDDHILMTFEPDDGSAAALQRFEKIYPHYFEGEPTQTQYKLTRYSFAAQSPYADLELFVGRLNTRPAFIRCDLKASSLGPILCERTIKITAKTTVRYRFSRSHLPQWKLIDATVTRLVRDMFHFSDQQ